MTIYTFDPYWWNYWENENNFWYKHYRFNRNSTFTESKLSDDIAIYTCLENNKQVQLRRKYMIPVDNYNGITPIEARIKKLYAKCKTTKHWG